MLRHTGTRTHRGRAHPWLLEPLQPEVFPFERSAKLRSALRLLRRIRRRRPDLVVGGGERHRGRPDAAPRATRCSGVPFVFCSGDAVGPFLALRSRVVGALGGRYERMLCRRCAGFVGWTPYLAGRALTLGAPRAMSAPGWTRGVPSAGARERVRERLGIAEGTLVVGLVGSLHWNPKVAYAYGAELVQAIRGVRREDVAVCVVGDGSGLERLEEMAGDDLGRRVLLPGRVAPEEVPDYLAAFDLGSLSQSVDAVGSFRYTTKLPEYLAAGLPVISGQTPLSYDMDTGFLWRLPGAAPWSPRYISALAELLEGLSAEEVARRRAAIDRVDPDTFDRDEQQRRMCAFVMDVLDARAHRG